MAITIPLIDEVIASGLAYWRNRFPGRDHSTEGFLGKTARACSMLIMGLLQSVEAADNDATPSSKTSTEGLDDWAFVLGLPDGEGGYGRKKATAAANGQGYCTGENATVFGAGGTLTATDGTIVQLVDSVTVPGVPPGSGQVLGSFIAVTKGTAGNLPVGTILTWDSPPAGADNTITLTVALSGGEDEESDADLLTRVYDRLQKPPKGGANSDYKSSWGEDVDGVDTIYVYPLRGGAGSVHVLPTVPGTGTGRVPGLAVVNAVLARLDDERPTTVNEIKVLTAYTGTGKTIKARVLPFGSDWDFDWLAAGTVYTVDTYTAGPPSKIKFNTLAPDSLKNAIDASEKPRIQVCVTGSVTPIVVTATAWADAGGKTEVTLEATPSIAPAFGDELYPGGPIVAQVVAAIIDYVDSLGPSRASGYADPTELWEDTLRIDRIKETILAQRSVDGDRIAENTTSVLIDGAAVDIQASDDRANQTPELLYLLRVIVTD